MPGFKKRLQVCPRYAPVGEGVTQPLHHRLVKVVVAGLPFWEFLHTQSEDPVPVDPQIVRQGRKTVKRKAVIGYVWWKNPIPRWRNRRKIHRRWCCLIVLGFFFFVRFCIYASGPLGLSFQEVSN
jgi:hypothetical protein